MDGELTIEWMTKNPAPNELLLHVHCRCKTGCSSVRGSCYRAKLPCTDACSCEYCPLEAMRDVIDDNDNDDEFDGSDDTELQ